MKRRKADENKRRQGKWLIVLAAICLLLSAVCRFVLPGVRFSALLFLGGAVVCLGFRGLDHWSERSKVGRRCRLVSVFVLAAGCVLFLAAEGMILWAGERPTPDDEPVAVVVLGAGVNGTIPSLTLRTRLDAAAEYLQMHPDVPAVLSGGQGPGEDITEAQAMYTALIGCGIAAERLLLEERSTSTAENLAYSMRVLESAGLDTAGVIAIVTNDFHLFRAQMLARDAGMNVIGVPAELPWWWLNANYYIREFFALGKLLLLG
ncbi:MAG: YdcF family protein [Ruminococcaceae bacterium]|nr:YdcF family protein [Oscillospiraceae bacterium]